MWDANGMIIYFSSINNNFETLLEDLEEVHV